MESFFSVFVGIALSACCGFRIFVPFLVMGVAARSGNLQLSESFLWISSDGAILSFSIALILEISAYYFPWLDNLLDSAALPISVIAGSLVSASVIQEMSPLLKWTLAVILGGGSAGLVQGGTTMIRLLSTGTTGGLGNPIVSTGELASASLISVLSIVFPYIALILIGGTMYYTIRYFRNKKYQLKVVQTGT